MFDRLQQKPFLTVETGEAYQPLRLTYRLSEKEPVIALLNKLACLTKSPAGDSWNWYWTAESNDLHFESLESFQKNPDHPVRLGTLQIKDNAFYISLPSFKRACLAIPFFHGVLPQNLAEVHHVDFINKVFATDERLPHGFAELFKDEALDQIVDQRTSDYEKVQAQCEQAATAEEAFAILKEYTNTEAKKRLPYAERYVFDLTGSVEPEIIFLSFYIFLRGRELVAIKRWLGEAGYSLSDAADEVEQVFGGLGVDIID